MQSPRAGFKMTGTITAKARRTFKKSAGLYTLVGRMKKTRSKDLVFGACGRTRTGDRWLWVRVAIQNLYFLLQFGGYSGILILIDTNCNQ